MVIVNGRFLVHRVTGVERYAREILAELDKIIQPGSVILAIPPYITNVPELHNIQIRRTGRFRNILWEQLSLPIFAFKNRGILLNLCNTAPLVNPGIVCIHDVKIRVRPQDFNWKFLLWYRILFFNASKRAFKLITVSDFSKREISKYYSVDCSKIVVIPSAWQHMERTAFDEKALEKYNLKKGQYYFSLCSLEPNKNLKWIVERARNNKSKIFAIAGSVNKRVFADRLGLDYPSNLKLLGYVSDEEAKALMRDCEAFIFPSFYEGFGLTPLEAISSGCQKLFVSNTEVMREIYEDYPNYIDPSSPGVFPDNHMINDESRETILHKYNWKSSAIKLYNILFDKAR